MIEPSSFFDLLAAEGVDFVAGVPDSLLKEACRYAAAALPAEGHVITANEGSAVGLAVGHHLATGAVPLVYLQNSGIGNTVNPLLSLVDPEVYAVPLILLIGWRGEPGIKDEPQHVKQGRVTTGLLDIMEIPYRVLDGAQREGLEAARWAVREAQRRTGPVALLVRKGAFGKALVPDGGQGEPAQQPMLRREEAIERVIAAADPESVIVASTGMIARELYEYRRRIGDDGSRDFLTVGAMGHASQIALGIARARPEKPVVCLDGDGAAIMHLGGLATIGTSPVPKYLHVVLNNGAHDSVGGQPTAGFAIDLTAIAHACGYVEAVKAVGDLDAVGAYVRALQATTGPAFLEVRVATGSRPDLGRPKETPVENKRAFVDRISMVRGH